MSPDKVIVSCALTGVLTNPKQHPVPVTPEEMAQSAHEAFIAGASIMHIHFRMQEPGMGHLPTWDPEVAVAICDAICNADAVNDCDAICNAVAVDDCDAL